MQYQAVHQSEVNHSEEGAVVEDSEEYCPRVGSVVGTRTVSKSRRESTIDLVVESKHEQVKTSKIVSFPEPTSNHIKVPPAPAHGGRGDKFKSVRNPTVSKVVKRVVDIQPKKKNRKKEFQGLTSTEREAPRGGPNPGRIPPPRKSFMGTSGDRYTPRAPNTGLRERAQPPGGKDNIITEEEILNSTTEVEAYGPYRTQPPRRRTDWEGGDDIHYDYTPAGVKESSNSQAMMETVCGQLAMARLPVLQPEVFDGKYPLSFPVWRLSFDAMVNHRAMTAVDKLNLLNANLGGEAKNAISGYLMMPPQEAYDEAYGLLSDRYGDNFKLAGAFKDRLKAWPRIGGTDAVALRKFVDFLKQLRTAKRSYPALRTLDNESENGELSKKLPAWLSRQWVVRVAGEREATGEFPPFEVFVEFLLQAEKIANDPLARLLQKAEVVREKSRSTAFAIESQKFAFATDNTAPNGKNFGTCVYCREKHSLERCKKFSSETLEFRYKFIRDNRLCYGCLVRGHISRDCRNRRTCQVCQGLHPTSMHEEERTPGGSSAAVSVTACASSSHLDCTPRKSSIVVPIFISHRDHPEREELVYGLLDSQSDSSFITDRTARALGLRGREVLLSLSTMTANDKVIKCSKFDNLEIRGYNDKKKLALPSAYGRKTIPINRQHIPSVDMIKGWPHLETLREKLVPKLDCEVGALIGYDCPQALQPREVISAARGSNGPFGQKTDLGWGIVGIISSPGGQDADAIGYSHRIMASQVTGSQIVLRRRTKELISPADCLHLLERDFSDQRVSGEGTSVDERKFLDIMRKNTVVDSTGHYSMPLPFNKNREKLFDNRTLVVNRAISLKHFICNC